MSLIRQSLPALLREADRVLENRRTAASAPVVLWQADGETMELLEARIVSNRKRLGVAAPIIVGCGPRTGAPVRGVTFVEFPPRLLPLLNPSMPARYRVAYSGRGAAKSWSFARALILRALVEPVRVLCAREYQGSIAESVHKLLSTQVEELRLDPWFTIQRDSITSFRGAEFLFTGLHQNVAKIKSTENVSIAWVEEAERVSDESWQVLIPTIRKPGSEVWITFNPDAPTDPTYRRFVTSAPPGALVEFVSYRDNPWLPSELDAERRYLESVDADAAAWIWEGKCRAASDAQIFAGKYSIEPFEAAKEWEGPYFGLDFGFAQDPTAGVRCWIHERRLYIERECHAVGCDIDATPRLLEQLGEDAPKRTMRADCARPETISYLQRNGWPNVTAAEKWQGSVDAGISFLRSFEKIVIHPRCVHTAAEFRAYSFKTDRLTGDVKPEPVDAFNHSIDALRYALSPLIRSPSSNLFAFYKQQAEALKCGELPTERRLTQSAQKVEWWLK